MSNPLFLTNINTLGDKLSYQSEETSTPSNTQYHEENEEIQEEKISIKKKEVLEENKGKKKPLFTININKLRHVIIMGKDHDLSDLNEDIISTPNNTQTHEENEEIQEEKILIEKKEVPGKNKRKEKPPMFTLNINELRNDLSNLSEETIDNSGILEVNEEINEEINEQIQEI